MQAFQLQQKLHDEGFAYEFLFYLTPSPSDYIQYNQPVYYAKAHSFG